MKIRSSLREHYRLNGSNWVPKKSFKSWKQIKDEGYSNHRWKPYRCKICNSLHIASIKKDINYDY